MVELMQTLARDIDAGGGMNVAWSPEGAGLCRALHGHRNSFGTVWHFYCEADRGWINQLLTDGQLVPRMTDELQQAIEKLDYEDLA